MYEPAFDYTAVLPYAHLPIECNVINNTRGSVEGCLLKPIQGRYSV